MGNLIARLLGRKETQIVEEIEPVRKKTPKRSREESIALCMLKALGKRLP